MSTSAQLSFSTAVLNVSKDSRFASTEPRNRIYRRDGNQGLGFRVPGPL